MPHFTEQQVLLPIIGGSVVMVVADFYDNHTLPTPGRFIAVTALAIGVSLLAGPAPQIAVPAAWAIGLGIALARGVSASQAISNAADLKNGSLNPTPTMAVLTSDVTTSGGG